MGGRPNEQAELPDLVDGELGGVFAESGRRDVVGSISAASSPESAGAKAGQIKGGRMRATLVPTILAW